MDITLLGELNKTTHRSARKSKNMVKNVKTKYTKEDKRV